MGPVPELDDRAKACADRLLETDRVLLASHIDADGLTSAAIASTALERAGLEHEAVFKKQLDAEEIASIAALDYETVLFTDFGSGQLDVISQHVASGDFEAVIADHHQPSSAEDCASGFDETDGYGDFAWHLNPLLEGIDGASELSGAGASYVLARAMGGDRNRDLAALAVTGAVGDMQATGGELVGANERIVAEGVEAGVVTEARDLSLYGKQTRPLPKLLEYASDVHIPGVSNDESGAIGFLSDLDLDLQADGEWRRWIDLSDDERQALASALVRRAVSRGVPAGKIDRLVATTYTFPAEPEGTELRDASEFSTLLNATARYERADVGLAVCLGERGDPLERARRLLETHRRNLSEGIDWVTRKGVTQREHVQYFHAGDRIRETIVGIVAGMALGNEGVSRSKPIVAFARKNGDELKVSARGTGVLVGRGLDLSVVMREASRAVGGDGGGHDVAAGATIPAGCDDDFLEVVDRIVGDQLD
ncbi:MAG: DHHA1 domain-containing protein [Halapricum sp.]